MMTIFHFLQRLDATAVRRAQSPKLASARRRIHDQARQPSLATHLREQIYWAA